MRLRAPRRDLIVRIGGAVRFARLIDGPISNAIWERLPLYGAIERTVAGSLALPVGMTQALRQSQSDRDYNSTNIVYCPQSGRILFNPSVQDFAAQTLIGWAELAVPFSVEELEAITGGTRTSLLHADS
jgi:hypothetical protein